MPRKPCIIDGCDTTAVDSSGKCKKHGGGKKCNEGGCDTAAVDSSGKCKKHGGGKKCNEEGCTTAAHDSSGKCKKHGGGVKCTEEGCNTAAFDSSRKCRKHGGGMKCTEEGCNSFARSSSDKCIKHGGGPRCPNCISWPDSRGGSKLYDGYCATCFKHLFPHDERSKVMYEHSKEIRVRNAINEHFKDFIHDTSLYTGHCDCTMRRRIDHRKLIGATLLCIETDEFAHASYDPKDEEIRYDDLYMIHGGKFVFIRFNPDGKGVDMVDKLERLIDEIETQIERIENEENTELLEVIKLFY
jgi:hypothetical protein